MTPPADSNNKKKNIGFLWFAIIAFALMLAVWLTLFILAARNPVQEVPLKQSRQHRFEPAYVDLSRPHPNPPERA